MELVVSRWSNDEERTRVVDAATEDTQKLGRAIAEGWDAGHVRLPGNLQCTLRYAQISTSTSKIGTDKQAKTILLDNFAE